MGAVGTMVTIVESSFATSTNSLGLSPSALSAAQEARAYSLPQWVVGRIANDGSFNCLGRFRADVMDPNRNCDPGLDPNNPQWGCKDDAQCPPPNVVPAGHTDLKGAGVTPGFTRGYFLIVDLERVYSTTLGSTLCVSYPRESASATAGWSGTWGKNCRGSSLWDPTRADDAGLPQGDWCSRTNSPRTETCHDAYLNESFSTAQAFKIKPDTCGLR
jgi:hypothetical protein